MRLFRLARSGLRSNILVSGGRSRGSLWALLGLMVCPRKLVWGSADG